jgi:hypothetical protein
MSSEARKDHLHTEFTAEAGDVVEVVLDNAANVQLLDPTNYGHYENRRAYRYRGGHATHSPFRIVVPHAGRWHVVVDMGGMPGAVRAAVRLIPAAQEAAT